MANSTALSNFASQNYTATRQSVCHSLQPFLDMEARENLPRFYRISSIWACVAGSMICLATLLFNTVVIIAIWRTPVLHQPRNVLLCSLAISDFFVGLTSEPSFLVAEISLLRGKMEIYCLAVFIHFYTGWMFNGISFLTLSAISFERYIALRLHLRYAELITTTRVLITALIYWAIWVTWITLLIAFCCLTLTAVAWCYVVIYKTVKRHNKQIQSSQQQTRQCLGRYRRTTKTIIILISAFVLSYFPFTITSAISASQEKEDMKTSAAHSLAVLFIFGNSAANPLIYFWRVADLREAAKQAVKSLFRLKMAVDTDVTLELETKQL